MDRAMTKAPLGGEKTGPNPTDRGKKGAKRSIVTDGRGVPIGLDIAGSNRVDFRMAKATVGSLPVDSSYVETTRKKHLCLERGYDYAEIDERMDPFKFTDHTARRGDAADQAVGAEESATLRG